MKAINETIANAIAIKIICNKFATKSRPKKNKKRGKPGKNHLKQK